MKRTSTTVHTFSITHILHNCNSFFDKKYYNLITHSHILFKICCRFAINNGKLSIYIVNRQLILHFDLCGEIGRAGADVARSEHIKIGAAAGNLRLSDKLRHFEFIGKILERA